MTTLPTIPANQIIEYQNTFTFANFAGIFANTARILITGMPYNYVVCGAAIQILQQFSGPSLTSLTCSVGAFGPDSLLTNITYYLPSYELTQVATPTTFELSGPPNNNLDLAFNGPTAFGPVAGLYLNGPHDIATYFISTGAQLYTISQGIIEVTLQIRPI